MTKTTANRIGLCALGAVTLLLPQTSRAQAQPSPPGFSARDGTHDFDFLIGDWKAHLKQLVDPLTGSTKWVEYEGTSKTHKIPGSDANWEEFKVDAAKEDLHKRGQTLRLYIPPPTSGTSTLSTRPRARSACRPPSADSSTGASSSSTMRTGRAAGSSSAMSGPRSARRRRTSSSRSPPTAARRGKRTGSSTSLGRDHKRLAPPHAQLSPASSHVMVPGEASDPWVRIISSLLP